MSLLTSVQEIMNELSSWRRGIPGGLKVNFSMLDRYIQRETVSTFLHYYSCINMTARPLVYYVIQRRLETETHGSATGTWQDGLSGNIITVINNSIDAARKCVYLMHAAAKHRLVGEFSTHS